MISLVASAALGEAVLFLAANSPIALSGRRVALVRELSRIEIRRVFGLHEGSRVPPRLLHGVAPSVLSELHRAAKHGTQSALLRYRPEGTFGGVRLPAA